MGRKIAIVGAGAVGGDQPVSLDPISSFRRLDLQRDAGRARLDTASRLALGISPGDIVEIELTRERRWRGGG